MPARRSGVAVDDNRRLSIDQYQRSVKANVAKARRQGEDHATSAFIKPQQRYLAHCVDFQVDPDPVLLTALRRNEYALQLDALGKREVSLRMSRSYQWAARTPKILNLCWMDMRLENEMKFLRKGHFGKRISFSLGSVTEDDEIVDLRNKFIRLGMDKPYAQSKEGAALAIRSVCLGAYKSPRLVKLHIDGVRVDETRAPLLAKAISSLESLESLSLAGSALGDRGIAAIAVPLGNKTRLLHVNFARCGLTDEAKEHICKIITLFDASKDERVWSSSLRGEEVQKEIKRPTLLINLSNNSLGDTTADALATSLYHDKWVLGMNLSGNNMSTESLTTLLETCSSSNTTIALLLIAGMKNAKVDRRLQDAAQMLLSKRIAHLQAVPFNAGARHTWICDLLLDWGLPQKLVTEISAAQQGDNQKEEPSDMLPPRSLAQQETMQNTDDADAFSQAKHTGTSTLLQIEYLIRQLTAMEATNRKMNERLVSVECRQVTDHRMQKENEMLRQQVKELTANQETQISPMEFAIIADLEESISLLTEQVENIERRKPRR
ncbi:TPA: LOW QUALITY PROTEIN: hypothetical protein N0F65_001860 [Lagenidium giganteum]|uniref:Uncharacterized protein n=1 Tax=Lagenidium giganteum TaxID=4803 RepID=A0AAV2YN06_9STRA|nr:TPA: LOW QUALITY PROTEIN: hypothetical protein N0F65_001860 [Lagenidium giganteum]